MPPPPPSQVPFLRTAYDQLRELHDPAPAVSAAPRPAAEHEAAGLASLETYLECSLPSVRAEHDRGALPRPLSHYGGAFTNPRSSAAPLPSHARLPTITAATRHFPRTRDYARDEMGAGRAPPVPPRRTPAVAVPPSPGSPGTLAVEAAPAPETESPPRVPASEAVRPQARDPVPGSGEQAEVRTSGALPTIRPVTLPEATVTDLDVAVAQLDNPSMQYEWASLLSDFLGSASTAALTQEELQSLPVGRVELDHQRISSRGKRKKKCSVVGVRVDRCGICLQQFRESQLACIFPCVHMYVYAR